MSTRKKSFGRAAAAATTLAVSLGGLMVVSSTPASAALTETDFGFQGTAYGTRVFSRGSGLESARSAYSIVSCTRLLGEQSDEHLTEINLPSDEPYVHVEGVTSDNETYRRAAQGVDAAIRSTNHIADVRLGNSSTPQLVFEGMSTTSTAWSTESGKLKSANEVTMTDMDLLGIDDPAPGSALDQLNDALNAGIGQLIQLLRNNEQGIEIPGLGLVSLGYLRHSEKKNFAVAAAFVLRVQLYGANGVDGGGDDTLVGIGHSRARINRDLPAAVMGGVGFGADAKLLDGVLSFGKLAEQPLPCRGTEGRVLRSSQADINPGDADQLTASGLEGRAYGNQWESGKAVAWTEGRVSGLSVGPLELQDIIGRVNLKQNASGDLVRQDIKGSSVGELFLDGESQGAVDPSSAQPIEIPGVANVDFFVKEKTKRGMKVNAVVITLLDGSPGVSVIRLGNASAHLKRR